MLGGLAPAHVVRADDSRMALQISIVGGLGRVEEREPENPEQVIRVLNPLETYYYEKPGPNVRLQAIPEDGYEFVGIDGGGIWFSSGRCDVVRYTDKSLVFHFRPIPDVEPPAPEPSEDLSADLYWWYIGDLLQRTDDIVARRVAEYDVWRNAFKDGNDARFSVQEGLEELEAELAEIQSMLTEAETWYRDWYNERWEDFDPLNDAFDYEDKLDCASWDSQYAGLCDGFKNTLRSLDDDIRNYATAKFEDGAIGLWDVIEERFESIALLRNRVQTAYGTVKNGLDKLGRALGKLETPAAIIDAFTAPHGTPAEDIAYVRGIFGALESLGSFGTGSWNFIGAFYSNTVFRPAMQICDAIERLLPRFREQEMFYNYWLLWYGPDINPYVDPLDHHVDWPNNAGAPLGGDGYCFTWGLGNRYICDADGNIHAEQCVLQETSDGEGYYGTVQRIEGEAVNCAAAGGKCGLIVNEAGDCIGAYCAAAKTICINSRNECEVREDLEFPEGGEDLVFDPETGSGGGSSTPLPNLPITEPAGKPPDDTYDVSVPPGPKSGPAPCPECAGGVEIAVLSSGYAQGPASVLNKLGIPYDRVSIRRASPANLSRYPVLIIPSGGLSSTGSVPSLRNSLRHYVNGGGTVIAFSQQYGRDYEALPGGEVSGYGWEEDLHCQHRSSGISDYHPILSGQDDVICDLGVDGCFTQWPENTRTLLTRTKNSMPAMIMYEYGEGTVIATTAYTDWAQWRGQATSDGVRLLRDMLSWALDTQERMEEFGIAGTINLPVKVTNNNAPMMHRRFELGESVVIPTTIVNSSGTPCDTIRFSVSGPNWLNDTVEVASSVPAGESLPVDFVYETTAGSPAGNYHVIARLYKDDVWVANSIVGGFSLGLNESERTSFSADLRLMSPSGDLIHEETRALTIPAYGTETIDFTYDNPGTPGIWTLALDVYDVHGELVHSGTQRFAVSKFAENPGGWVYRGNDLTYAVNSDGEQYWRGQDATFTITVWNNGDSAEQVTFWYSFPHNYWKTQDPIYGVPGTTSPGHRSNLHRTLTVLPGSSESYTCIVPVYSDSDTLWVDFYRGDETSYNHLGRASTGRFSANGAPSVQVNTSIENREYFGGMSVPVELTLVNLKAESTAIGATINILDHQNSLVTQQSMPAVLIGAKESFTDVVVLHLPTTVEAGTYFVRAEATEAGRAVGSGSTRFEVTGGCPLTVVFDHPDGTYRARDSIAISVETMNTATVPISVPADISVPHWD